MRDTAAERGRTLSLLAILLLAAAPAFAQDVCIIPATVSDAGSILINGKVEKPIGGTITSTGAPARMAGTITLAVPAIAGKGRLHLLR